MKSIPLEAMFCFSADYCDNFIFLNAQVYLTKAAVSGKFGRSRNLDRPYLYASEDDYPLPHGDSR